MQAHRCQSLHRDICIIEHKGRRVRVQQETIITDFPKSPVLCRLDIIRPVMDCHHPTLWVKLHLKRPEAPPIDRGRHTDGQLSAIDNSSPLLNENLPTKSISCLHPVILILKSLLAVDSNGTWSRRPYGNISSSSKAFERENFGLGSE